MGNYKTIFVKDILLALVCVIFIFSLSCTPEEEKITTRIQADLSFSTDTVLFDTVFSRIGSITKRLVVRNRNQNAVKISSIYLGRDKQSSYTITVNGKEGIRFKEEILNGGDSLLILVEVTVNPGKENLPFLVKDSIVFETNENFQNVKLVAYGQDANFIRRAIVDCNTIWTADKPYVLSDTILVDSLCQLTIEKGAKIYFDYNSALFVGGTLVVNGTADNKVLFRNSRLDVDDAFGQWGGIYFLEGSKDHKIDFAEIRNGTVGLYIGTPDDDNEPDIVIGNTILENMATSGILAFNSDIYMYNTLANNCVEYTLGNFAGGNYHYEHCTFANFGFGFFRQSPAVALSDNVLLADGSVLTHKMNVRLLNTIIYGSLEEEMLLDSSGGSEFNLTFSNNIIKTRLMDFNIDNNIINEDPEFISPGMYNYNLDTLSPAKDAGAELMLKTDLNGNIRDAMPDIGAYERIEK